MSTTGALDRFRHFAVLASLVVNTANAATWMVWMKMAANLPFCFVLPSGCAIEAAAAAVVHARRHPAKVEAAAVAARVLVVVVVLVLVAVVVAVVVVEVVVPAAE